MLNVVLLSPYGNDSWQNIRDILVSHSLCGGYQHTMYLIWLTLNVRTAYNLNSKVHVIFK